MSAWTQWPWITVGDGDRRPLSGGRDEECVCCSPGDHLKTLPLHNGHGSKVPRGGLSGSKDRTSRSVLAQARDKTPRRYHGDWSDEEEEDATLFLRDPPAPDDPHYITTHHILLAELSDSDGDLDPPSSASRGADDGEQVRPFVQHASLDRRPVAGGARPPSPVSNREHDPGEAGEPDAAEGNPSQPRHVSRVGQIHLSIRTTSPAINGLLEEGRGLYEAVRPAHVSRGAARAGEGGGRPRVQGGTEASSEPDDEDREVGTLTAHGFRSLARPRFHLNLTTSSESSASGGGNRCSASVDVTSQKTLAALASMSSVEMSRNIGSGGNEGPMKGPGSQVLAVNTSGQSRRSNKVELRGPLGQGVITLTETLNFRCNVKSGSSEGRKGARDATGSGPTEEVADSWPGSARRVAPPPPHKPKEDASKKAIFASSLIKNVISKKMQFEQERKMERGEISEQQQGRSPSWGPQEGQGHRHSSKVINADLGHTEDGGSGDAGGGRRGLETTPFGPETHLEWAYEAGIDSKKGVLDASQRTLLRSQNSAFRRWRDGEEDFDKDHEADGAAGVGDAQGGRYGGKVTKMSHLLVPSIRLSPSEGEEGQQLHAATDCVCDTGGQPQPRSHHLHVASSRNVMTSKSPEIKINLRSVKNNKTEPVAVSKLQTSNIGYGNPARHKDFRRQTLTAALKGEAADKVPHFTVRDIRDNKAKLHTPIHQVRDVRKLVKSSYHFVSLDKENRPGERPSDPKRQAAVRHPSSVSPIVIKCQSVNTNSGKQSENLDSHRDLCPTDAAKSSPLPEAAAGGPDSFGPPEGDGEPKTEGRGAPKRLEKIADPTDKKSESKVASQMALEKLQAAVRTMEQLYVFEKNEWKRKTETRPLTDSHVLSLIAGEEHEGSEAPPGVATASPGCPPDKHLKSSGSVDEGATGTRTQAPSSTSGSKSTLSLSSSLKNSASTPQQIAVTRSLVSAKTFAPKSTRLPKSLKNTQLLLNAREEAPSKESERLTRESSGAVADNENYLTIPAKCQASSDEKVSPTDGASVFTFTAQSQLTTPRPFPSSPKGREDPNQTSHGSGTVTETPTPEVPLATVYHSLPQSVTSSQPQLFCFSPAITPAPALEPFQTMQRKILLDPTTGNYYLVDSPVQPPTKRLFDPETGQYVEFPMPQPSTTPVPMSVSPLALSSGVYGHTYMVYPGFMPTPTVISQLSLHSEGETTKKSPSQKTDSVYMDSPFYIATGKSAQPPSGAQQQATSNIPLQPIISITSQQGPRIIAPPSFDGTTMSFVVEHR